MLGSTRPNERMTSPQTLGVATHARDLAGHHWTFGTYLPDAG
jgi:hypothetical protein